MILINNISSSDIENKDEVITLSNEAANYLSSFNWCKKINNGWVAKEFGYILSVFYFEIEPDKEKNADNNVWIIVGDIPSVYIDIESANNADDALKCYCLIMEDWINCVKNGESIEECYPINVPATIEYAIMLESRIKLIKSDFIDS